MTACTAEFVNIEFKIEEFLPPIRENAPALPISEMSKEERQHVFFCSLPS